VSSRIPPGRSPTREPLQLETDLRGSGLAPDVEYELNVPIGTEGARVSGRIDCLVVDDARQLATVYEVKTGRAKPTDRLQTMLYMHFLAQRGRTYRSLGIRGVIAYPDGRVEVKGVPDRFAGDVEFFLDLLLNGEPRKRPGSECGDCKVHRVDCSARLVPESDADGNPAS
jgi:hypothetical protein